VNCIKRIKLLSIVLAFFISPLCISAAPLVGIDMVPDASPLNWNNMPASVAALSNLINEQGDATTISFTIDSVDGGQVASADPTTIPLHPNSLENIASYNLGSATITGTYRGLDPGQDYFVWVFGMRINNPFANIVSVTGAGPTINFTQYGNVGELWVNGERGDNTRDLASFAVIQTADQNGSIQFTVDFDIAVADRGVIAGVAIQAIPEPTSTMLLGLAGVLGLYLRRTRA